MSSTSVESNGDRIEMETEYGGLGDWRNGGIADWKNGRLGEWNGKESETNVPSISPFPRFGFDS